MSNPQQPSITGDVSDVKNGPLAKAGSVLIQLYLEFLEFTEAGSKGTFSSTRAASLLIEGTNVKLQIRGPSLSELVPALRELGMQIEAIDPPTRTVGGQLPIAKLLAVAQHPEVSAITPVFKPDYR